MDIGKKTVLATVAGAIVFLFGGVVYKQTRPPEPIVFNLAGHPSIGKGPIEFVLFEDFCCTHCRIFTEEVFPQIAETYVFKDKATLTVVLVAFTEHSKMLANAALIVHKIALDQFIPFVLELSHSKASGREGVLRAAEVVGKINLDQLAHGIDYRLYYGDIDQNLVWARNLMGNDFGTPSFFINGIETATDSFEDIVERVRQVEDEANH
jgi:protein-disulfide isomerase